MSSPVDPVNSRGWWLPRRASKHATTATLRSRYRLPFSSISCFLFPTFRQRGLRRQRHFPPLSMKYRHTWLYIIELTHTEIGTTWGDFTAGYYAADMASRQLILLLWFPPGTMHVCLSVRCSVRCESSNNTKVWYCLPSAHWDNTVLPCLPASLLGLEPFFFVFSFCFSFDDNYSSFFEDRCTPAVIARLFLPHPVYIHVIWNQIQTCRPNICSIY